MAAFKKPKKFNNFFLLKDKLAVKFNKIANKLRVRGWSKPSRYNIEVSRVQ